MKIMKKLLSVSLALAIVLTMFSFGAIVSSAEAVIENIKVDLSKSASIGGSNITVTPMKNGVIDVNPACGWYPNNDKAVTEITWPNAVISLKNSDGDYITIKAGYKYVINVKYTVTKASSDSGTQVAIVYNDTDSRTGLNGAHTLAASAKHTATGTYTLTAETDGVADRPLRLAFGGKSARIAIESVEIERVATNSDVKIVNYVENGRTTKGFAFDTLKTPEYQGAYHAVFGGWFTDSAFATAATTVTDGATYYAKWTSVTHKIDLTNSNRMSGYNEGQDTTVLNVSNAPYNEGLVVKVNQSSGHKFANGTEISGYKTNSQITLEYADYDTAVQDAVYNNYASLKNGKHYSINVKYSVVNNAGTAKIAVMACDKSLSYGNGKARVLVGNNDISGNVDGAILSATTNANGLVDYTYGGGNLTDYKLRLSFDGKATFIIEYVTITEVYTEDIDKNVVAVNCNDNGSYYIAAAKDLEGNWQVPQPVQLGDVVSSEFGGWYTNSACTTPLSSKPALKAKVYPKWVYTKYNVDLNDYHPIGTPTGSNYFSFEKSENNSYMINVGEFEQRLFASDSNTPKDSVWVGAYSVTLEYFDNDPNVKDAVYYGYAKIKSGYNYVVSVNYNVVEASSNSSYYPQIAVVTNQRNLSENEATKVWGGRKHTEAGENYTLSAVINGATADHKLRLAFGGAGKFEILSVEITEVFANDTTYSRVNMQYNSSTRVEMIKNGSEIPALDHTLLTNFGGWYNGNQKVTVVSENVTVSPRWFGKYDITMDGVNDIRDLISLKDALASSDADLLFDIDRDSNVGVKDSIALRKCLLGKVEIGGSNISDYTVVKGAQKTLLTTLAAETLVDGIATSFDANLTIADDAEKKIVVGVPSIDEEVLNSAAINSLTGVNGDVYGINDYKVFMHENNLHIEGGSDYAVAVAVNTFVDFVNGNKCFPADIEILGNCDSSSKLLDGYSYSWGDEFNGDSINTNKWYFRTGESQGTNYARTNSYYIASSSSLKNSDPDDDFGGPWIDPDGNPNMQDGVITYGENYTMQDGMIVLNTKRIETGFSATEIHAKQGFTYGIMTARVKLATKNGACSSVWSRTNDDNGASVNEMDFVENFGADQVIPNLRTWEDYKLKIDHDGSIDRQDTILPATGESMSDTFHEIALYWTEDKIVFYFDGEVYLEQDISSDPETWEAFHKSTNMIFNVSIPSNYYADSKNGQKPGDIMGSLINSFSENLYVDYVRVYQQ